ncbi:hypothetical protein [Geodermatophilus sp. CPCC 205506]|uniref:hypothetical protein n=1 Tax=Geodermatophilus sp. CPCC 205506 TaxID=2936596 RepID=UPI003EE8D947
MTHVQLSDEVSRRLRRVFDDALPAWDQRTRRQPDVQPGSGLDGDLKAYPRLAAIAWQATTSAVDHLKAVRDLWLTAGTVHTFAAATLLRAALLAAAIAVYLLDDSPGVARGERVKRAALAALTDHRDHLWHQKAMAEMTASLGEDAVAPHESLIERLQQQVDEAHRVAREHGATQDERRRGLVDTTCIVQAGRVLSRHQPPAEQVRLQAGLRAAWQKGSADAHARTWQTTTRRTPDGGPLLRADMDELMTGLNAATLVLNEAWRLWELRAVNHLDVARLVPDGATQDDVRGSRPGSI